MKDVLVGDMRLLAGEFFVIAGPCVVESEKTTLETLEGLKRVTGDLKIPFIFKCSYDKANRTSVDSYRGPGIIEGLKVLKKAKEAFRVPILTDVHCKDEVERAAEVADVLQIPALLSRQTDLIVAAGKTGRAVNIKKGQFMTPHDMKRVVEKAESAGCRDIILTERGTSFGYNNLVVDMRGLPIMRALGYPVVFDATHSVQLPSAEGKCSGGDRALAAYLARAAVGAGVDGVFMEVHPNPDSALCDGPNSISIEDAKKLIGGLKRLDEFLKNELKEA
jgi:2-dehydro-3-deoxyphosphooctonate aldolase (KDO 8-P synthase)